LESTIFTLAAAVENLAATAFIVVAGNLLVVLLEGMVVMIQTTRLVLFEFFMRFFEGGGRPFLPASAPSAVGRSQQSR
jgi:V/A-type H+-transporting ATPase subunit I